MVSVQPESILNYDVQYASCGSQFQAFTLGSTDCAAKSGAVVASDVYHLHLVLVVLFLVRWVLWFYNVISDQRMKIGAAQPRCTTVAKCPTTVLCYLPPAHFQTRVRFCFRKENNKNIKPNFHYALSLFRFFLHEISVVLGRCSSELAMFLDHYRCRSGTPAPSKAGKTA